MITHVRLYLDHCVYPPINPAGARVSQVLWEARLDADLRMFVLEPPIKLLNPEVAGYQDNRWTAYNLFPRMPIAPAGQFVTPRFPDEFSDPSPDRGDPFHCRGQLRKALRPAAEVATEVKMRRIYPAAYALALALGRCRLFGVTVPAEEDFTLSPTGFRAAAAGLIRMLRAAQSRLSRFDEFCRNALRKRMLPLDLLQARMDAWAVYLALDESYAAHGTPGTRTAMSSPLRTVQKAIEDFDVNLQNNIQRLAPAAATFALENWRRLLAPSYKSLLPWWLET